MGSLVTTIDVSGWQPTDLTNIIRQYDAQHVIVKLQMPWETAGAGSPDHSRAQIKSAQDNGCTVGGYVFCYASADPTLTVNYSFDLCDSVGLIIPLLWLDHEEYGSAPPPSVGWLDAATSQCDALESPVGIYTRYDLWHSIGNPTHFSHRPLWNAYHDDDPDFDFWRFPYGGWTEVAGEQYQGSPVDVSIFRPEFTKYMPPTHTDEVCHNIKVGLSSIITAKPYIRPSRTKLKKIYPGPYITN